MRWLRAHLIGGGVIGVSMLSSAVRSMTSASSMKSHGTAQQQRLTVIHWFRHGDLRLHDNPALTHSSSLVANKAAANVSVLPVFVFDSKIFGAKAMTRTGSLKCGPKRAQFILESVTDLRQQLRSRLGSDLLVAFGEPSEVFDQLFAKLKGSDICVVCQQEVVKEEKDEVKRVETVLRKHCANGKVSQIWGSTLYELSGMPYEPGLHDMPNGFTPFRTKVEKKHTIAKPLPIVKQLPLAVDCDIESYKTFLPTLQDLGYTAEHVQEATTIDPRGVLHFRGGESVALARVKEYIWDKDLLKDYFDTRNGMIGGDYSTKFSPWLAHGCLSPRHIAMECKRYEQERVANKSTYWVIFELLWRDFCKFFALKSGDAIFFLGGIIGSDKKWTQYEKNFVAWKEGRTGYPLVDANMREMKATGFMSNRGRQNVASFLAIDLAHDWRCGGDWFESQLIDYDVYSNWVVSSLMCRWIVRSPLNASLTEHRIFLCDMSVELVRRGWYDGWTLESF